jgi:adenosine deaminase
MTDWRALPKAELHCHLLGVIDPLLLSQIQSSGGTVLVEPCVLRMAYPVSSLASFTRWLQVLKPYQAASVELMRPILAAHIANLIAQRVVYTEIMLSPTMFPRERDAMRRAFDQWREWTFEMEQGKTQVEYLMVMPRTLDAAVLEHDTQTFIELRQANLIVGVALVGVESGESIQRFSRAFARSRDAGLGIEIHAGEHSGPESVRDAVRFALPDRLGHCISAFQDQALVESLEEGNVHIEFCPTSNLRMGAITDLERHPIRDARERGLNFSINTDDPGAFGCSVESEHQLMVDTFGFSAADFRTIFRNSLAARFQPKLRYLDSNANESLAT